jgi:hypothetical protein
VVSGRKGLGEAVAENLESLTLGLIPKETIEKAFDSAGKSLDELSEKLTQQSKRVDEAVQTFNKKVENMEMKTNSTLKRWLTSPIKSFRDFFEEDRLRVEKARLEREIRLIKDPAFAKSEMEKQQRVMRQALSLAPGVTLTPEQKKQFGIVDEPIGPQAFPSGRGALAAGFKPIPEPTAAELEARRVYNEEIKRLAKEQAEDISESIKEDRETNRLLEEELELLRKQQAAGVNINAPTVNQMQTEDTSTMSDDRSLLMQQQLFGPRSP